jgi:hypothetical protein
VLDNLLLAGEPRRLLPGLGQQALGLVFCFLQHLLALFDDPTCLLDLFGNCRPHLVEQIVDLVAVDHDASVLGGYLRWTGRPTCRSG